MRSLEQAERRGVFEKTKVLHERSEQFLRGDAYFSFHACISSPPTSGSTQEQTVPPLPDPQTFQQYLRELARGAIREVLERVMREELDALIGVGQGESSPRRKGYRNGYDTRDLVTTTGRVEDVQVPRDREGQFHTQVFERYRRFEPQVMPY